MFRERVLLVPQYIADEEMKKARYHEMLSTEISAVCELIQLQDTGGYDSSS